MEWSRAKANRVLPRERTGHSKHPLPTSQEKTLHMDITRWSTPNQIDYILCSQRWRGSRQSAKTRPGADCGSDHELLITKFRLKLKKVGKTARPFRYDLNQTAYVYTEEGDDRGWDGWMVSWTWWTWAWVNSGRLWWTRRPGVLRFMGSQRVRHDWVTGLNWTDTVKVRNIFKGLDLTHGWTME